jgi:hemolysin III
MATYLHPMPPASASTRAQTRSEELANALSHALGCPLALLVWPALAHAARAQWGSLGVVAVTVFCATMALQYLASTAYHALPTGRAKLWARAIDHAAIFVFIAGSSTPFTLGAMGGVAGVATCMLVWALALLGVWLKLRRRLTNRRLSTGVYVLLAWLAVVLAWPGLSGLEPTSLMWLLGGAAAYLVGTAFFVFDSTLRFGHFVWHLFVLAGSSCHVLACGLPLFPGSPIFLALTGT